MNNPVFQNYQSRMRYAAVWIFITIIQTLVVYFTTNLPFGYALTDSLIFNTIFACCIIPIWYPVYYIRWKDRSWYSILMLHTLLMKLLILVWISVGYSLMYLFWNGNPEYIHFPDASVLWKLVEGLLFYIVAVLVYYLYIYVDKLNEKANNEIYLNKLIKDGELNLLKSQINPHFLFNSLNSVNSLIIKDPAQAQEMLVALSDYLRYTVLATRHEVSLLQEEMDNVKRYLSIEKLRFGKKLQYEFDIHSNCLPLKVPSMLLQPLFENAVKHGVYESIETVSISAKATIHNDYLNIEVSNDFDPENLSLRKGSGTGLKNISERLRLSYGNMASLQTRIEERKFIVILEIPF